MKTSVYIRETHKTFGVIRLRGNIGRPPVLGVHYAENNSIVNSFAGKIQTNNKRTSNK